MAEKKRIKSTNKQCDNCGSNLVFDPVSQNLKCLSCHSIKEIFKDNEIIRQALTKEEKINSVQSWAKDVKVFRCDNCGGEVLLEQHDLNSCCQYCGSSHICETQKLPGIIPDAIIPFALTKEMAKDKFKESVKKKFFVPERFKKDVNPEKIRGYYVPSFRFSTETHSIYTGRVAEKHTTTVNGKRITRTTYKNISGEIDLRFLDLIVEAGSKITESEMNDIQPYENEKMFVFQEGFIRGYPAEHYDEDLVQCDQRAKKTMNQLIKKEVEKKHSGRVVSLSLNTTYSNEKYIYCLLPVYNFDIVYNKTTYTPKMNGQTGKVGGRLPRSWIKVSIIFGFFVLLIAVIVILDALNI